MFHLIIHCDRQAVNDAACEFGMQHELVLFSVAVLISPLVPELRRTLNMKSSDNDLSGGPTEQSKDFRGAASAIAQRKKILRESFISPS
jgi:hypothetical protein